MLAKRTAILIKKSLVSTIPKVVWEHEIPVLNFKYGAHKIERITLPRLVQLNPMNPMVERGIQRWAIEELDHDAEWNRMNQTYGKHEESGQVCTEMAYGYIQERRMETQNEARYRPMIEKGHSYIKQIIIPDSEYEDGLTVFEPEDQAPAQPMPTQDPAPEPQETKSYDTPLGDPETVFKLENLTKPGIIEFLNERGIEHDENATKEALHALFMDSMKPVGVDPEPEE